MEWSKSVMVEVGTEDSGHQNRVDMMLSALKQGRQRPSPKTFILSDELIP